MSPKRSPAQDTLRGLRRGQIVAAARALVAAEGLEGLTIGALEARLGYSRGVITYHFRDKEEIVAQVLRSAVEEIDAATAAEVSASATPGEKVRAVLRANVRGFLDRREAGLILLSFWGRLSSDARARKVNAQLYAGYRERTAQLLAAGRAAGAFAKDVDPQALAALIVGIVLGIASQAYFEPGSIDVDAAVEEGSRCVLARLGRR